jgi:hypothetical protein
MRNVVEWEIACGDISTFRRAQDFQPFDNSLLPETAGKMPNLQTQAKH